MQDKLRELQLLEVEEFKRLVALFEEKGIKYYALGGTMLGAVRHYGFIPWDDDIDIGIPRNDYETFLSYAKNKGFELHGCMFDEKCKHYPARLYLKDVYVKKQDSKSFESAWISIFPLDGLPNSKLMFMIHCSILALRRMLFRIARMEGPLPIKNPVRSKLNQMVLNTIWYLRINRVLDLNNTFVKLDIALKKYSYEDSNKVINLMGAYNFKEIFPKKIFGDGVEYDFEDIKIKGPFDFEYYLTHQYGDWRKPPAQNNSERNHHCIEEIVVGRDNNIG